MEHAELVRQLAAENGFDEMGFLNVKDLRFYNDVRKICESNGCGQYNKTWFCPPATGTLEECREKCMKYDKMLLFNKKFEVEDSFDFEGMMEAMVKFQQLVRAYDTKVQEHMTEYMILGNESGCKKCKKCTYPDEPCRSTDKKFYPIESFGFRVDLLAKSAGIHYNNGTNTVTYFGGIFF